MTDLFGHHDTPNPIADPDLPQFDVGTTTQDATTRDVLALIRDARLAFNLSGTPVHIDDVPTHGLWADEYHMVPAISARMVPLTSIRASAIVERVSGWFRTGRFSDTPKPVPTWVSQRIAEGSVSILAPIAGIIRHPVLRDDGTLLTGNVGYDPRSQFYVWCGAPIDTSHHWESAEAALDYLRDEWLDEVFFDSPDDLARALMLCLTLMTGRTILKDKGKYPGFLATAPMPASGKTELVECLCLAVIGSSPPFAALPIGDDVEMNKLLMGIIIADPAALVFDNVQNGHCVKSAVMDQFVTRTSYQGRILGANKIGDFPALSVVIMTGNNISVAEDSRTRFLEIRLQPDTDNPQGTIYKKNLREYTEANRGKIISALVTIANAPHEVTQQGRFPGWFNRVAGPVMQVMNCPTALDVWTAGGETVERGDAFGELMERMHFYQTVEGGESYLTTDEMIDFCGNEYEASEGLDPGLIEAATQIIPDAWIDKDKHRLQIDRDTARKKIAKGMVPKLKRRVGQQIGGLRFVLVHYKDGRGRVRTGYSAQELQK